MNKKYEKIMSYFLVFIMLISYISPIYGMFDVYAEGEEIPNNEYVDPVYPEVSSDKYTLNGLDLENNTLKVNVNDEKIITLESEEDYYISSCGIIYGDYIDSNGNYIPINTGFINSKFNEKSCTIEADNFGKVPMMIEISNKNGSSRERVKFYVDVESENYLDIVVDGIPDEITYNSFNSYIPSDIIHNYYNTLQPVVCEYDQNTSKTYCNVEFKYCHSDIDDTTKHVCISKTKKLSFNGSDKIDFYLLNNNSTLKIGESETIEVIDYYGKFADLIWVSENNNIASVDSNGKITAKGVGETLVKVYDKLTYKYLIVNVTVFDNQIMTPQDLVSHLENKSVTIDINHENNVFAYDKIWTEQGPEILPQYYEIAKNYVSKFLNNELDEFDVDSATCDGNKCSVTIVNWNNNGGSGIKEEHIINNITINLKGININSFATYGLVPSSNISRGILNINETFDLTYTSYLEPNSEVIIKYDEEYFIKEETNIYKAIKSGYTEIEVITNGYSDKVYIMIKFDQDKSQDFTNYVSNLNTITLPYNSLNLGGSNLKYLQNIVANKLVTDYPNDEVKKMLTAEVKCLSANVCNYRIFSRKNNDYLLGSQYEYTDRVVKINYIGQDSDTVNEIKRLDSIIKEYYAVGIDTIINLEKMIDNDDLFYDSLINYTDLINIESNLDIEYVKIDTFKLNPYIKGGVKYLVKISKDNNLIFTKEITVTSDHVVGMEANLDKNDRSEYLKNYVDNVLKSDSTNTLVVDNIYEVTVGEKTFNLILDQKDYVKITHVDVMETLLELKTGETKKIQYITSPKNGTSYDKIVFDVENDNVVSVDKSGNITAVGKGYTYIDVKCGYSISRILVIVDTPVKEVLNSYLNYIDNHIKIDYADLRYGDVTRVIEEEISDNFYGYNFWFPFQLKLKLENGKYYVAIAYNAYNYQGSNIITSDYKEITYSYEGIKVDKYIYHLNTGDEVETNLSFTEGDNNNLYFSYEKYGVVKYDKSGILKALKPGITDIYIKDKYNKFWNYITVIVSFDEFFDSVSQSLRTDKIRVNALDYRLHTYFDLIVEQKLKERISLWNINKPYNLSCDESNLECTFTIYKYNSWGGEVDNEVTFEVIREGIFIDEQEVKLDIDEEKEISYTLENDNEDDLKIISLNKDICKIENNKVVGVGPGLCTVKYTTSKNLNYQHFLVGEQEIINVYQTALTRVNDGIEVPLLGFDDNNHNFENTEMFAFNFQHISISNKIENVIGLDTEYFVNVNFSSTDELEKYNDVEIMLIPQLYFEDSRNNYYYQYKDYEGIFNVSKEIDIIPVEINKEDMKIGTKIKEQVKDRYRLSLLQYLRLRLDNKSVGLHEYSDFVELVKKECRECTIEKGGNGDTIGVGYILEGGTYIVFKGNNPIAAFDLTFEASIEVLQSGEIFSELEFINLIKETVRDAYLKAIRELTGISRMSTRNVKSYRLNDEVEVDVKKEFDPSIGQNAYVITVDDITFKTTAKTETVGEVNYTYSVTNLELSESNLTLNKGQSKVIGYSVTPDNATNKEVKFESSNNNVVTVDGNGTVIATGAGTATITVTTKDGTNISKQVNVTVIDNNPSTGGSGEAPSEQQPEIKVLLGDINVDGKINMNDLITLRKYFAGNVTLSSQGLKNVDITKDGKINMNDLIGLRKFLAN